MLRTLAEAQVAFVDVIPELSDYWRGQGQALLNEAEEQAKVQAAHHVADYEAQALALRDEALKELTTSRDAMDELAAEGRREGQAQCAGDSQRLAGQLTTAQKQADDRLARSATHHGADGERGGGPGRLVLGTPAAHASLEGSVAVVTAVDYAEFMRLYQTKLGGRTDLAAREWAVRLERHVCRTIRAGQGEHIAKARCLFAMRMAVAKLRRAGDSRLITHTRSCWTAIRFALEGV